MTCSIRATGLPCAITIEHSQDLFQRVPFLWLLYPCLERNKTFGATTRIVRHEFHGSFQSMCRGQEGAWQFGPLYHPREKKECHGHSSALNLTNARESCII